jgi:hypothetical protein
MARTMLSVSFLLMAAASSCNLDGRLLTLPECDRCTEVGTQIRELTGDITVSPVLAGLKTRATL